MRSSTAAVRAAAVFFVAGLSAQPTPDFTGRWVVVPDTAPAAGQRGGGPAEGSMGSGWGPDITVTQDAKALTIQFTPFIRSDMQPPFTFVYLLDGSESRNTINMGRGPQEQVSRAAWDGGKLVITTTYSFKVTPDAETVTGETKQVLSLESPASLVVETTRGAVLGGPPSTTRTVYKKSS